MSDLSESEFRRSIVASPWSGAMRLILRADQPEAWAALPDFFECIQSISPADMKSDHHYNSIVRMGVKASVAIIENVGFELSNSLHSSIWDWIVEVTESDNAPLAAEATYSLEKLGIPPICVQDQLLKLMKMPPRSHPDHIGTCRAVAFRVLMRLNEQEALLYFGHPAFVDLQEMLNSIHNEWVNSGRPTECTRMHELENELRWLQDAG